MWELRRTVGSPRANGIAANGSAECLENPYGGTLNIATLPANCCNKSVTFTTFKPGENPYGADNRYGPTGTSTRAANGNVSTMSRPQNNIINSSGQAPCLYEQPGGELLYSTHNRSRPDILTDSNRLTDGSVSVTRAGDLSRIGHAHRSHSRDLCEQCVTVADCVPSSSIMSPPPPALIGGNCVGSPTDLMSAPVVGSSGADGGPSNVMLSSPL